MIHFPRTEAEAAGATGDYRAGATDLHERRRLKLAGGPVIDLRDAEGLTGIEAREGSVWIGARTRVAALVDAPLLASYPGLGQAAAGLATPQIRAVATLGGNLLQQVRCWYYRHPELRCLRSGGDQCLARGGDHLYHACFDLGPCVAPHPSTLGVALVAQGASVELVSGGERSSMSIAELYGSGEDPRRTHQLPAGALLTGVVLPPPRAGERAAYFRATNRARAEWPLVEALARLVLEGGVIREAGVAIGGVATIPLRLPRVEAALTGSAPDERTFAAAAAIAADGARPLPMTGYKVELIPRVVLEALERARDSSPAPVARAPAPATDPRTSSEE